MNHIKRILVVDDEKQAVNSLLRHLWREGFDTDSAFDGLEACKKLEEASFDGNPFDLIIVDVVMPRMNGLELFNWVKERYPSTSAIFISAFDETDAILEALRDGIDGYGRKPSTPREMMQLIESVEQKRASREEVREYRRGA